MAAGKGTDWEVWLARKEKARSEKSELVCLLEFLEYYYTRDIFYNLVSVQLFWFISRLELNISISSIEQRVCRTVSNTPPSSSFTRSNAILT